MYNFYFNNASTDKKGLGIVKRPNIPSPKKNVKATAVTGGDGSSYFYLGGYDDITITVQLNILKLSNIKDSYRDIRNWLINYQDNKLIFSDDSGWCYKVKDVTVSDIETTSGILGTFTVSFICDPYMYEVNSTVFRDISNNEEIPNSYMETAPVFYVEGSGDIQLYVGRNEMIFNIPNDSVYVDCVQGIVYDKKGTCRNLTGGSFQTIPTGGTTITYNGEIRKIQIKVNRRTI